MQWPQRRRSPMAWVWKFTPGMDSITIMFHPSPPFRKSSNSTSATVLSPARLSSGSNRPCGRGSNCSPKRENNWFKSFKWFKTFKPFERSGAVERFERLERMFVVTAAQMREMDRLTIQKYGVSSLTLMERAGEGITKAILERFGRAAKKGVWFVAGKGNNGGGGLLCPGWFTKKNS